MKRMLLYSALGVLIGGTAYSGQYTERVRKIKDDLQKSIAAKDTATYQKAMDEYVKYVINPVGSKTGKTLETKVLFDRVVPEINKLSTEKSQAEMRVELIKSLRRHKTVADLVPSKYSEIKKLDSFGLSDTSLKDLSERIIKLRKTLNTDLNKKANQTTLETDLNGINTIIENNTGAAQQLPLSSFIIKDIINPKIEAGITGSKWTVYVRAFNRLPKGTRSVYWGMVNTLKPFQTKLVVGTATDKTVEDFIRTLDDGFRQLKEVVDSNYFGYMLANWLIADELVGEKDKAKKLYREVNKKAINDLIKNHRKTLEQFIEGKKWSALAKWCNGNKNKTYAFVTVARNYFAKKYFNQDWPDDINASKPTGY